MAGNADSENVKAQTIINTLVAAAAALGSLAAQGQNASLRLGGGLTTYKSKAVVSNDTAVTTGYILAIRGGSEQQLGVVKAWDSTTTSFAYANSTATSQIVTAFQSTTFRYYWGPVYVGPAFTQAAVTVNHEDTDVMDAMASGYGVNIGARTRVGRRNELMIDVLQSSPSVTKDVIAGATGDTAIGARMDVFLGGSIALTRSLFSLILGFRQRSHSLTITGTGYAEVQTTTWLGLRMDANF